MRDVEVDPLDTDNEHKFIDFVATENVIYLRAGTSGLRDGTYNLVVKVVVSDTVYDNLRFKITVNPPESETGGGGTDEGGTGGNNN